MVDATDRANVEFSRRRVEQEVIWLEQLQEPITAQSVKACAKSLRHVLTLLDRVLSPTPPIAGGPHGR